MGIALSNVTKSFFSPDITILKGVTLSIQEGEWVSITGRSGSGKSTLLYVMSTLDPPSSGEVSIDGARVDQLSASEIDLFRNQKMGFVFQFHYLIPELTILENVLFPCKADGTESIFREQALRWLEKFGLNALVNRYPNQLSGGEQQRAALARALVKNPKYLFADEPTGNLDSQNGAAVMSIFHEVNQTLGTTVIMVTHDPEFAKLASRIVAIKDGSICSS